MTDEQTDKARPWKGLLLFLVSICVVGAVIVVIFGAASVPLLDSGKEILARSSAGTSGEAQALASDQARASVPAPEVVKAVLPAVNPAAPQLVSTQEAAPMDRPTREGTALKPAVEPVPSIDEPSPAKPDRPQSGASAITTSSREQQADRTISDGESPREPPASLSSANPAPLNKIPAPSMRSSQSRDHTVGTKTAARQLRLKRECGPIRDPTLHRHCVASFAFDHPMR